MSQKVTIIEAGDQEYLEWGHIDRETAIKRASRHFLAQYEGGMKALSALRLGKAKVFHQMNQYAAKDRRELKP